MWPLLAGQLVDAVLLDIDGFHVGFECRGHRDLPPEIGRLRARANHMLASGLGVLGVGCWVSATRPSYERRDDRRSHTGQAGMAHR